MFPIAHPEVLADDWLPPVPIGRASETGEVVRRLDPPRPRSPPPWIVAVSGPAGSGTSTIARRAAREVADRLRESGETPPRILAVRTATARGTHGVATALLQRLDEGFDGRGFPTTEVLAGLLRRLRRAGHPAVFVLDDVAVGGPDLAPIVRALVGPDRFLPEGEHGLPPVWTIVAGSPDGLATGLSHLPSSVPLRPHVVTAAYSAPVLAAIVRDRAQRALGRDPPASLVASIVERTVADGGGAGRSVELLRRELLGLGPSELRVGPARRGAIVVEPQVVDAIGRASRGAPARLSEVRRWEAKLARQAGRPPLPTTTFWRRLVRLERAGYLRREIRTGGPGGTLSVVRLLTPIDEWVTVALEGTRPTDAGARFAASATGWGPVSEARGLPGSGR
jgi:hypothetical protein